MTLDIKNIKLIYQLKEGTKSSYYLQSGPSGYLPNRLSIGKNLSPVRQSNKTAIAVGQIKGAYKVHENGMYKGLNKGEITSSIFPYQNHQNYTGYFILDERHKIFDLWIINSTDQGITYQIDYFPSKALNEKEIEECFTNLEKEKASF